MVMIQFKFNIMVIIVIIILFIIIQIIIKFLSLMVINPIPIVNFILLLVWAFSASTPVSKANWAKASLIFILIGLILCILFWGAIGSMFIMGMQ